MLAKHFRVIVEYMLQLGTFISDLGVNDKPRRYFDDWFICSYVFSSEHAWVLRVSFAKHHRVLNFWVLNAFFLTPVIKLLKLCLSDLVSSFS